MTENGNEKHIEQNVFLYNREHLEMSGICDVYSFSETSIEMTLDDGYLAVDGENLRIDSFNSATGKITVLGKVYDICYFDKTNKNSASRKKKKG